MNSIQNKIKDYLKNCSMCKKMVTLLGVFYNKLRPIQGKGNACTIKGVFWRNKSIIGNDNYISIW